MLSSVVYDKALTAAVQRVFFHNTPNEHIVNSDCGSVTGTGPDEGLTQNSIPVQVHAASSSLCGVAIESQVLTNPDCRVSPTDVDVEAFLLRQSGVLNATTLSPPPLSWLRRPFPPPLALLAANARLDI